MNKLSRQFHDGRIILDSKTGVKVAIRAAIAAGTLALAGLILLQTNDAPPQPNTQTFRPRTGPTFELPRSDDGPSSTTDPYSLPEQSLTLTTLAVADTTP